MQAAPDPDTLALLRRLTGFDRLADEEQFIFRGYEAFRHLVRVTAGLESSLLGENHVVSQMKDALDEAAANGWSGPAIRHAGAEAMRVAKAVRREVEGLLSGCGWWPALWRVGVDMELQTGSK